VTCCVAFAAYGLWQCAANWERFRQNCLVSRVEDSLGPVGARTLYVIVSCLFLLMAVLLER
jgi:hypothetical protein